MTTSETSKTDPAPLTKKDYKTDQDVRWCPGCGDYGVLNAVQSAFAKLQPAGQPAMVLTTDIRVGTETPSAGGAPGDRADMKHVRVLLPYT